MNVKSINMDTSEFIEIISNEMRQAHCVIAMTGGGISVPAGVPMFDADNMMWGKYDFQKAEMLAFFEKDPSYHWIVAICFLKTMLRAIPSAAHIALANMEKDGSIKAIVTTNLDHLHQEAGSKNVIEFHGSFYTSSCPKCSRRVTTYSCVKRLLALSEEEIERALKEGKQMPRCKLCNAVLKVDIPFFDQGLPIAKAFEVERIAIVADLMLVIGTRLRMGPIGLLPNLVKANNGKVAIINLSKTTFDKKADYICRDNAEVVLPGIQNNLLEGL